MSHKLKGVYTYTELAASHSELSMVIPGLLLHISFAFPSFVLLALHGRLIVCLARRRLRITEPRLKRRTIEDDLLKPPINYVEILNPKVLQGRYTPAGCKPGIPTGQGWHSVVKPILGTRPVAPFQVAPAGRERV